MICPHCKVSIPSGKWKIVKIKSDKDYNYSTQFFECVECNKISIKFICNPIHVIRFPTSMVSGVTPSEYSGPRFSQEYLIPKTTPRDPIPKDVEDIYRIDYDKAVKLLHVDSMASAAYSRRLLQHYIEKKHKIKEPDLKQELKKLEKLNHYPLDLIKLFDHIRHYGKFAAHATTNQITGQIIDIDPEEAEWLLFILEQMFVHDYELARKIKQNEKKIQDKLKSAKPPQKKLKQ